MKMFSQRELAHCAAMAMSLGAATTATWEMNTYQDFLKGRFQGISLDRDGRLTRRAEAGNRILVRPADHLEHRARARWFHLRRHRPSRARLSNHRLRREHSGLDCRSAGGLRRRCRFRRRSLRGHFARRQGLSHREGKGHRVLCAAGQVHLGARVRQGRNAVRGRRQSRQYLSRRQDRQSRDVLRNRPIARDGAGLRFARQRAGRHRAQRHPLSDQRQGQGLRACTTRACRRSAPSSPCRTAPSTRRRWAVPSRIARAPLTTALSHPLSVTVTAPATSITVTDSADSQAETEIKPKAERHQAPPSCSLCSKWRAASPLTEIPGVDKSAVYKINPDDTVETLWSSKEENVYSMVARRPMDRCISPPTGRAGCTGWARIARRR